MTDNKPETRKGTASPLARFAGMVESVPEASDGSMDNLIASVLSAKHPSDLGSAWESQGTEALIGKTIQVISISRSPSSYEGGLGVFLVVNFVEPGDDEVKTFTTGAISVVLQLVKAHSEKWLPLDCVVERSKTQTKDGFYPLHLKVLGVSF